MRIVGVICEYNPLHTGHRYHLEQARTGADAVIAVMSGDFVQRGEPAVCDKYARAEMALRAGADAVIELPPVYSTGSAEVFARGGIQLLNACGCIDELCFGAECGQLESLRRAAALSADEAFGSRLREALRRGQSFAAACAEAAESLDPEAAALLSGPNNILAVEYLKALEATGSRIEARAVRRRGASYGEKDLPDKGFASAAAVRKAL
ncbi:MAG: nucleotidyltransferase family protein, partial [Lachnospiraceae bacterium]|nr:nucleotidyltransferase family protein [Lachnospiraceae bacterium]